MNKQMNKLQMVGFAVAVSVAIGLVALLLPNDAAKTTSKTNQTKPHFQQTQQTQQTQRAVPVVLKIGTDALSIPNPLGEIVLGDPNAPITVVEYSSLTCGHCGTFHNDVLPSLKREYVDTGKVKFYFRPFPFDSFATAGAMLTQCTNKPVRMAFLTLLFKRQDEWTRAKDPMEKLQSYSRQTGMSAEEFVLCLRDKNTLEGIRKMQSIANKELGVKSTPTFFINGKKIEGNVGVINFRKALDKKLKQLEGKGL